MALYDPTVRRYAAVEIAFEPKPWPFAAARRGAIDSYFAEAQARNPKLWNGRVLITHRTEGRGDIFRAACLETDFAAFLWWRDAGWPDPTMANCFGMGALRGSCGGYVAGVMGAHTANPGRVYFAAGTPEPADVVEGRVDLEGSIIREIEEETGLTADRLKLAPDWTVVFEGRRIAAMREVTVDATAEDIAREIRARIAADPESELADVAIMRSTADLVPDMLPFMTAYLQHAFADQR